MRRITARGAVASGLAAACLAIAGCSGQSATEQRSGGGGGAEKGVVTISHWQHHSDAREKLVKQFVKDYPDANIDFQSIPYESYFQKLGAALEAGNGPCVFQIPANIVNEFYGRDQLAPVPDSIMSTQEIDDAFTRASTRLLKIKGRYYALPTDVQTLLLFYNDDLFKKAGLDPTKDFSSWEELRQAAIKLTKTANGKMTQAGIDMSASPYQWFYGAPTVAYPEGLVDDKTHDVDYDSDPGYQAWDRITGLVRRDHVDDPEFLAEQSKFGLGKAGMTFKEYTFSGVYKLTAPDLNYSVHVAPPVADKTYAATASTSWSYAVSSACAHKEAAWKWAANLTSEDSQRKWIAAGGELPSRKALLADKTLQKDPNDATAFASLADAMPYDAQGWDDAYAVQQKIWDQIVLKGDDVRAAVDTGADSERALYRRKGLLG